MIPIKNCAVFLDRDGVINEVVFHDSDKPSSPWKFEEFKLVSEIKRPLDEISSMGYYLFIVSNQPDISRGYIEAGTIEKINNIIYEHLPIQEILVCPHDDKHNCYCRKPRPGMLIELSKKWGIDLKTSFLIGDNWKDIEAGKAAGCTTILLDKPYNQAVKADYRVTNLEEGVNLIKILERALSGKVNDVGERTGIIFNELKVGKVYKVGSKGWEDIKADAESFGLKITFNKNRTLFRVK